MTSQHTTQLNKQAIAEMLGCVVSALWTPRTSFSNISDERGYNDTNRVFGDSMQ